MTDEIEIAVRHIDGAINMFPIYPMPDVPFVSVPCNSRGVTVFRLDMRASDRDDLIRRCKKAWGEKRAAWFQYNQTYANFTIEGISHMVTVPIVQIRKFGIYQEREYGSADGISLWIDVGGMRGVQMEGVAGAPDPDDEDSGAEADYDESE